MPIGPNDVTLTGFTLTGGTISGSTISGGATTGGTISGSTFVNCISTAGTLVDSTLNSCQISASTIDASTITNCAITGSTFTGNIGAGTTITAAQLKGTSTLPIAQMTSSALLSTPVAGGLEYDGVCGYLTGANTNRQVILTPQVATLASSYVIATDSTGNQRLFNSSTNGAVNVGPNMSYLFECGFEVTKLSTTAGSIGWGFGGTAGISAQFQCIASNRVAATTAASATIISYHTANSTNCIVNSASTLTQATAFIKGKIVITTSGTLIPSIFQGTSGATTQNAAVSPGAYFVLTPIGDNTVLAVGGWT